MRALGALSSHVLVDAMGEDNSGEEGEEGGAAELLLHDLGDLLYEQKRPRAAEDAYVRAAAADPTFIDAHIMAGVLLYNRSAYRASARHFRRILSLQPDVGRIVGRLNYDAANLNALRGQVAATVHMLAARMGRAALEGVLDGTGDEESGAEDEEAGAGQDS